MEQMTEEEIQAFASELQTAFTYEGESIVLGGAMAADGCLTNTHVKIPLSTLNRHGLIAGAKGTGKTRSVQVLAEQLSAHSVPVLLMDLEGDLSGIAKPGVGDPAIDERMKLIGNLPYKSDSSPVEFFSISNEKGARLRATVTEFGPLLFSKILDLNKAEHGVVEVIFKYSDDYDLPLLDLKDFKDTLQWFIGEGKDQVEEEYGRVSSAIEGTIIRKIVALEQQGADKFFGERSFEVDDLVRINGEGKGVVSIIRLTDIQDRPHLYSTFILQMLAEIYAAFPKVGEIDQPKLVIFIDEAHLFLNDASEVIIDQLEAITRLIGSRGVGLVFVTQNPADISGDILGQLGLKVQHALQGFTEKDRKANKFIAQKFPWSDHYNIDQLLTELGIGEALVTVLNEDGLPTPLARTMVRAPQSRMDALAESEITDVCNDSLIVLKYAEKMDREIAHEILSEKISTAREEEHRHPEAGTERSIDKISREKGRALARELTRGLLGALGVKSRR